MGRKYSLKGEVTDIKDDVRGEWKVTHGILKKDKDEVEKF